MSLGSLTFQDTAPARRWPRVWIERDYVEPHKPDNQNFYRKQNLYVLPPPLTVYRKWLLGTRLQDPYCNANYLNVILSRREQLLPSPLSLGDCFFQTHILHRSFCPCCEHLQSILS